MGSAGFDRKEDHWPRQWAEAYIDFASGEKRAWLYAQGMRWFPVVGWAERGGSLRPQVMGNSVPRFHITWGTGTGVVEPFIRRAREAEQKGLISFRFRHRVTALVTSAGHVDGVEGEILVPSEVARSEPSSRIVADSFALKAQAIIVASGGIGGNHDLSVARRTGRGAARDAETPDQRCARPCRWPDARRCRACRRAPDQQRPHVALCGGCA